MTVDEFAPWFEQATGFAPRDWQLDLGAEMACRDRLIRIPTGFGKTLGVVATWAFHRLVRNDPRWPRRLVMVLPMRVLVEQTVREARSMLERAGLLDGGGRADIDGEGLGATVHMLMGGVAAERWHLCPEQSAVLIGTQDMLLSRALNRGYASPRPRWPMEFGLLSQDSLWLMDEVQLMGVGLTTSAQLQRFRSEDHALQPTHTWWMSATLQHAWFRRHDDDPLAADLERRPLTIAPGARTGGLFDVSKTLEVHTIARADDLKATAWAELVWDAHRAIVVGEHGRITLAVCNTVDEARALRSALARLCKDTDTELLLVHSRFRGLERAIWAQTFLRRDACGPDADRILVATQVVEAGVDISAGALVTQLSPWSSLVQRFGRCARYGGEGRVFVVDRQLSEKQCLPYAIEELDAARQALNTLRDVGIAHLESFEDELQRSDPPQLSRLYPYSPLHVLTRRDYDELFDTESDLTGEDLDVSRFIREGDERDLSVFWWALGPDENPPPDLQPTRQALCSVPVARALKWLFDAGRLKDGFRAWVWDYVDAQWGRLHRSDLRPGQLVLVDVDVGGYDVELGFTGARPPKRGMTLPLDGTTKAPSPDELSELGPAHEELSQYPYKTIATHGREVAEHAVVLADTLGIDRSVADLLALAGVLHDAGKCHPVFVRCCNPKKRREDVQSRMDLAKAPADVWRRGADMYRDSDGHRRKGFRHELVSVMMLFEWLRVLQPGHDALLGPHTELIDAGVLEPMESVAVSEDRSTAMGSRLVALTAAEFNLVAYLVCAHHGKVRGSWASTPHDQEVTVEHPDLAPVRGVLEGDTTPAVRLSTPSGEVDAAPELVLSLAPARLGLSSLYGDSWRQRVTGLSERWGPSALAYLETLLRVADVRASRLDTVDPLIVGEAAR